MNLFLSLISDSIWKTIILSKRSYVLFEITLFLFATEKNHFNKINSPCLIKFGRVINMIFINYVMQGK